MFGYAVQATDSDTNGIWIGNQNRTLVGNRNGTPQEGAITSAVTDRAADLTHGEIGTLPGHKVDGTQQAPQVTIAADQTAFHRGTRRRDFDADPHGQHGGGTDGRRGADPGPGIPPE